MKLKLLAFLLLGSMLLHGQHESHISTIEFVEILNNNRAEALFYFKNNWKVLREKALSQNLISGFQLMENKKSEAAPFDLMLMTRYATNKQYLDREKSFQVLISESGGLQLMNDKKPSEFRKSVFALEKIKHH